MAGERENSVSCGTTKVGRWEDSGVTGKEYCAYLAHDLVVGVHLPPKACRKCIIPVSGQFDNIRIRPGRIGANRREQDEDWALTMRLRIAHLNLQKALRDTIHLLNLHTQTSRIIAIRARSAPLELQHRCSREEDV